MEMSPNKNQVLWTSEICPFYSLQSTDDLHVLYLWLLMIHHNGGNAIINHAYVACLYWHPQKCFLKDCKSLGTVDPFASRTLYIGLFKAIGLLKW